MDIKGILATIDQGVAFAEKLLPMIKAIPVVGNYASMVETAVKAAGAVAEVVQNVKARVDEGVIVATSEDQVALKALIARLAAVNDGLNEYIVNS